MDDHSSRLGDHGRYPLMKAFARNIEIDPRTIGPPEMNYGQHQRFSANDRREYRYEMSSDEFCSKIGKCFGKFRQGEIDGTYEEDDASEFPQLFEWRSKDYPTMGALLCSDPDLLVKLIKYWEYDISHALSEFGLNRPSDWIVMSIDDVRLLPNSVAVIGTAYERL